MQQHYNGSLPGFLIKIHLQLNNCRGGSRGSEQGVSDLAFAATMEVGYIQNV
jgi:hypothetical protein